MVVSCFFVKASWTTILKLYEVCSALDRQFQHGHYYGDSHNYLGSENLDKSYNVDRFLCEVNFELHIGGYFL